MPTRRRRFVSRKVVKTWNLSREILACRPWWCATVILVGWNPCSRWTPGENDCKKIRSDGIDWTRTKSFLETGFRPRDPSFVWFAGTIISNKTGHLDWYQNTSQVLADRSFLVAGFDTRFRAACSMDPNGISRTIRLNSSFGTESRAVLSGW